MPKKKSKKLVTVAKKIIKKKAIKKIKLLTSEQIKKKLMKIVGMEPLEQNDVLLKIVKKSDKKITILREQLRLFEKQIKEEAERKLIKEEAQQAPAPQNIPTENEVMKELLAEEKLRQELEGLKENKINWTEDEFYDSWDKIKGHMKKLWGDGKEYAGEPPKWCFIAHSKDKIIGKPQLIDDCKTRMPLVRLVIKKMKPKQNDPKFPLVNLLGEVTIQSFYMVGELFDKRYNGSQEDTFASDFYKYVIKTPNDKRYFIFSQKKLPEQSCTITGMSMELDDFNEISKTMKIPQLSRIFFCKDAVPDVKTISKKALVKLTKEKEITEFDWLFFLAKHPLGTINNFSPEFEMLRSAFILQGLRDNWPFSLMVLGPQGSRKTMGIIEPLDWRINKVSNIAAATIYRLKGLIPSYKSMIADIGYLCTANRMAFIDELGKMIEAEAQKHEGTNRNILGDFNDILEHKTRIGGSGNANHVTIKANAKFLFVSNPCSDKPTVHSHVGLIDATAMGRILWWVQDEAEQALVLGENGILRPSPKTNPRQSKEQKK